MMLSEALNDKQKVLIVIFEVDPQAAMVKTSKCDICAIFGHDHCICVCLNDYF